MPVARPYNPDARKIAEIMQAQLAKINVDRAQMLVERQSAAQVDLDIWTANMDMAKVPTRGSSSSIIWDAWVRPSPSTYKVPAAAVRLVGHPGAVGPERRAALRHRRREERAPGDS